MVDYSEGILNLKKLVDSLHRVLLERDPMGARDMCAQIVAEARLVDKQVVLQFPKETGH
jgi:hypothetical protein